jgi:hypothetical protein
MKQSRISLLALISVLILVGCNNVKDEILAPTNEIPDAQGYYTSSNNGFVLKYKVVSDSLQCVLTGGSNGWISVGFDPTVKMQDANFIIGFVNNGSTYLRDDWGVYQTGHDADVNLGGEENVSLLNGSEAGGSTTLEFSIPLNSGDNKDKHLIVGNTYSIIFAKGSSDNFDTMHNGFGFSTITLH